LRNRPSAAAGHGCAIRKVVDMRLTDFWSRMEQRFGATYARSVAADYRLPALGATIDEAIASGVETRDIWRAVCEEFDVPRQLR